MNNDTNKQMLKVHKKTHTMNLRHHDKKTIQNVKTVRMQKSAIINMRKHLNKKHRESKNTNV